MGDVLAQGDDRPPRRRHGMVLVGLGAVVAAAVTAVQFGGDAGGGDAGRPLSVAPRRRHRAS